MNNALAAFYIVGIAVPVILVVAPQSFHLLESLVVNGMLNEECKVR